ncbi:hypothetical protein [Rummeliibacillus sp. TYF-LIM-RU47]|uniref:hypothetical protein n=1 Tax=Rummeliibacillus sp. TYF-LIM-RU47 TaxID=2608406 RepID=UPI00123A8D63|nr:hypothetical protein [Rummeliibacillus sp. TYF-LIM-RU47]
MLREFDKIKIFTKNNSFEFQSKGIVEEKVKGNLTDLELDFYFNDAAVEWFINAYINRREFICIMVSRDDEFYISQVRKVGVIIEKLVILID